MTALVHANDDSTVDDASKHAFMLSTLDNPYNPFTQYDLWYAFDVSNGYNSCSYLARIALTSDDLSDLDNALAIERAIDEIVDLNITGLYIKVSEKGFKDRSKQVKRPTIDT